jgi:hypothetical protein
VCETVAVYEVVPGEKTGARVPAEIASELKVASATVKVNLLEATWP